MAAVVVLILRVLLALALYAFLGWAFITLWRELRLTSQIVAVRKIPELSLQEQFGEGKTYVFAVMEITLGRDPTCDVPLLDDTISAHHLRLSYHHNQWWAEDLNSTNGSFLNDEKITTPTVMISGDELRAGQLRLLVTIASH